MEAIVKYDGPIDVEKNDGAVSRLNLRDQRVKIISIEGDNIYSCEPIGFPWKGKFSINRDFLNILESPKRFSKKYKKVEKKPRPRRLSSQRSLKSSR
jgi:hypothetical protein